MPEYHILVHARGTVEATDTEAAMEQGLEAARELAMLIGNGTVGPLYETELKGVHLVPDGDRSIFHTVRPWNNLGPLPYKTEDTRLTYADGQPIRTGDVVRMDCKNEDVHGSWVEYLVDKAPGGYVVRYLRSAKGWVLPLGYTGGNLLDLLDEEHSAKTMTFAMRPMLTRTFTYVGPFVASEWEKDRA